MEKLLCESVEKTTGVKCSDYPVKLNNTNTYICVDDLANNNKCMEKLLCESVTGITDEINCTDYPVS